MPTISRIRFAFAPLMVLLVLGGPRPSAEGLPEPPLESLDGADACLAHGGAASAPVPFLAPASAPAAPVAAQLTWREGLALRWDDFHGPAQPWTEVDAVSSCGIRCDPELRRDGTLRFTVAAYFSRPDSWVDGGDATADLLRHEQRHFDLAELYARKLRRELQATEFRRGRLNEQIKGTYDRVFAAYRQAQATYDRETAHSTDPAAQARWEAWIADELRRHRAWSGTLVRVEVRG